MVQFPPRERRNGGRGCPHSWNSFPSLERPGCETDHSPVSSTEVCSSTCIQGEQRDNLTFTSRNKSGGYINGNNRVYSFQDSRRVVLYERFAVSLCSTVRLEQELQN